MRVSRSGDEDAVPGEGWGAVGADAGPGGHGTRARTGSVDADAGPGEHGGSVDAGARPGENGTVAGTAIVARPPSADRAGLPPTAVRRPDRPAPDRRPPTGPACPPTAGRRPGRAGPRRR